MPDAQARLEETERLLTEAVADVPLTATGPEIAAALQSLALKLAERCMEPRTIAHVLLKQAEAYLKAAGRVPMAAPGLDDQCEAAGHHILEGTAQLLTSRGLPADLAARMMLAFAVAWFAKLDGPTAAETLYQHGDAIVGRLGKTTH